MTRDAPTVLDEAIAAVEATDLEWDAAVTDATTAAARVAPRAVLRGFVGGFKAKVLQRLTAIRGEAEREGPQADKRALLENGIHAWLDIHRPVLTDIAWEQLADMIGEGQHPFAAPAAPEAHETLVARLRVAKDDSEQHRAACPRGWCETCAAAFSLEVTLSDAIAALTRPAPTPWQPMETHNGSSDPVLLHWPYWNKCAFVAQFILGGWRADCILSETTPPEGGAPHGWMPLPPTPEPDGGTR